MPIFPVLEKEDLVQENDKTRLSLTKSFVSGADALTSVLIQPYPGADEIEVLSDMYLDWAYTFAIDVNARNNKLNFKVGDTSEVSAEIADGQYTLALLAVEIKNALDSGGLSSTVTVTAKNAFIISADLEFSLLPVSGSDADAAILPHIGFAEDVSGEITYTGDEVETVEKLITATLKNEDDPDKIVESSLYIISELADNLFSGDEKLRTHETDILKYVPDGRSSFKDVHRRAQQLMLTWLDTEGFLDDFGDPIIRKRFTDTTEVREWATVTALRLIFESISNAKDDVFAEKAKRYGAMEPVYRNRAVLRIDLNQDGVTDEFEGGDIRSASVVRR